MYFFKESFAEVQLCPCTTNNICWGGVAEQQQVIRDLLIVLKAHHLIGICVNIFSRWFFFIFPFTQTKI